MASSSDRRSASSESSKKRRRVIIGAGDRTRDRYASLEATLTEPGRSSSSRRRRPVPGDLSSAGRHVAGGKAEQRELRLRAHRRAIRLRLLAVGTVAVLGVLFGVWLYRSPAFTVRTVEVLGADQLDVSEVRSLAAIPTASTLLRLSVKQVERRLTRSAWIASAEVSRDFPDTVRIRVQERKPAATVDLGGKNIWLVDASGVWLARSSGDTTTALIAIRDVEGLDPVAGRRTSSETLVNALEIVRALIPSMLAEVRTISAPAIDKTALITTSDVEVFVGSSDDIVRKQQVAEKILQEQAGKVVYINVRTVERPTWRGLEAKP